jgi:uncharacterized membrane protein YidH (DUF202 family)
VRQAIGWIAAPIAIQVLAGILDMNKRLVTESSAVFACIMGVFGTLIYGASRWADADMTLLGEPITSRGQGIRYGM